MDDLFRLDGKTALVTGGAGGIGFAIAVGLGRAGAKVAFNCRGQDHRKAALEEYRQRGVDAKGYLCDVTDEAQVKELTDAVEKDLGGVDILVNNAGIIRRVPMHEMSSEEFRRVIDTDLTAAFLVSKAVLPGMRYVVIPQAIKNILPALGNELITLFKETSIVTVIGLRDLTKVAIQIQAKTYQAFMPFMGIAVMYLVVVMMKLLREGYFGDEDNLVFVHTGGAAALFAMDLPHA